MTRQRARSTGWLTLAITTLAIGSLLVFSGAVLADDVLWAEVDGYAEATAENNHAGYWGATCEKVYDPGGDGEYTFLLTELPEGFIYSKVIVKAGSDSSTDFANTIFDFPAAGETVWADTNGNGMYDAEKVGDLPADKNISHIIACTEEVVEEGSLTIVKETGEETETLFGFTGTFDAAAITPFDLGDGDSMVFADLGTYVITEGAVEGWYLADIDCGEATVELVDSTVEVTIADGDHVTCTFVNEMVPAEREAILTIVKDADGNTTEEFSFLDGDVSLAGGESFWIEFTDEDFGEDEEILVDIWETLTEEQEEALWELVDIDCDTESFEVAEDGTLTVSLVDGDDVTCTFFNEQGTPVVGALLSLEKAVPGAAANATEFGFTLGGVALASTVSEVDAPLVLANVAGTYVIGENAFAGWNLTGIECIGNATAETVNLTARTVSVPVANGENVVCTFTNTQPTGQVLPGNPTPTPTPAPRGAVLPSTAMPAPGLDAALIGTLLLISGGALGVLGTLERRRR